MRPPGDISPAGQSQKEGGSTASTMTELETAMGLIIDVFARYSGGDGRRQTLTKGELKQLMEKELPGFLQVRPSPRVAQGKVVGMAGRRDRNDRLSQPGRSKQTQMQARNDPKSLPGTLGIWAG
ncbi:Hypothetical predicted protein, partial [Marmota monax]